jgi:hypothetical protein
MNNVLSKLNISRINYWKHVLGSMTILLICVGSLILPTVLGLQATFLDALFPLALVVPFYNLMILIGRLRNIGGRSFILWFFGLITPLLGIVMIVRLGLIKAKDESDFSWKQRLFVASSATIYVIFYFTVIIAQYAFDYVNSQVG